MTLDWCPSIREACDHWHDAPMLQQNLEPLEQTLDQNNDARIECAKTMVEMFCQIIVESFHTPLARLKPEKETPNKLAGALNELRNQADPACHGKDPYLERLAIHHRRSAVLAADAIVAFLLDWVAYVEALNATRSARRNLMDEDQPSHVRIEAHGEEEIP